MKGLHVLIVDDREIVRDGLKAMIGEAVPECTVTETDDYKAMLEVLRQGQCTHLIIDPRLKGVSLLEKFAAIRKEFPDLYILVHTMSHHADYAGWLLNMGADAFLSKESGREEMIAVLTLFIRYNMSINADIHRHRVQARHIRRERPDNPFASLSPREQEMTRHMLNGHTSKEIQNALRLKSSTVSTMKSRIFRKLKVSNLVGLLKLADYCHFK